MIQLAAVGGGKMAAALLGGARASGHLQPEQIAVAEPEQQLRRQWEEEGCQAVADASGLPAAAAYLLCVKPQDLAAAATQLAAGRAMDQALTVSIVAGARIESLKRMLGSDRIVRAMPNTPAQIGEGCTFAYAAAAAAADKEVVEQLFGAVGRVFWVGEESLLDAATALAGSGPAYAFALIEEMATAGVKLGLDQDAALAAAAQTVRGAASMVLKLGEDPARLRANVTSKGGTTEAALAALARNGFSAAVQEAIECAHRRAAQLAAGNPGDGKKP